MIPIAKPIIGDEEKRAVQAVLDSGMIAQGPKVKELENAFAELCGTKYAIAVNSGTAALHTSLHAMGIGPGDEVITTPFTFVATANPVLMQGASLVFADIKPDTYNIDPVSVEKKITRKTKAIIAVDLYGQPADYRALQKVADEHDLKIVEDACQAVDAELEGKKAGSLGDMAAFSFYATKNIMSGEDGMITTDSGEYAELARRFRHHGQSEKTRYQYYDIGYNYRMMDIQAAIALSQLAKLENFSKKRIHNANLLSEGLKSVDGIITPTIKPETRHVFHQYTIRVDPSIGRDKLAEYLKSNGVGCAVFYPKPLHLHPHFARLGFKEGAFPVAERASEEVLSLPVHPSVQERDIDLIIDCVKRFVQGA